MHQLGFKSQLPPSTFPSLLLTLPSTPTHPPPPAALPQRDLREVERSAQTTRAGDCKAAGHSHSCLWAGFDHKPPEDRKLQLQVGGLRLLQPFLALPHRVGGLGLSVGL